jgi:hypothetical protein
MKVTRHVIASLILFWTALSANSVPAQQNPPAERTALSTEALQNGKLTFWISSKWAFHWDALAAELKSDYPTLQVSWQVFQPEGFLSALKDAQQNQQLPDVVFVDNQTQRGPLQQEQAVKAMIGVPRHGERGWWLIMKATPHPKEAEAFILWLTQPKDWEAKQPITQLLSAADRAEIQIIAMQATQAFATLPVHLPQGALDPAIASFTWESVRKWHTPEEGLQNYSPIVDQVAGNSRLAFVTVSTLEHGEDSFGVLNSFLLLRKDSSKWKLLFFDPNDSQSTIQNLVASFDRIGLSDTASKRNAKVTLIAPDDEAKVSRFPKTEIAFEQKGNTGELMAVESQWSDLGRQMWSPPALTLINNSESQMPIRMQAPFGVGKQPHRWRVWSVNKAGVVTLSEWRTVNFTN